ncbi:hypothetical protein ASF70_22770 [Rhizobium sp. Leaf321]|uniref:hypothetical protein n=1 Tax=Rhizobium sp. Leaf321 TaxID=1736335 RepID=UPI000715DC4B|nr:hypothetical protein [Rhizobium sp. Leaf321]KQQ78453.1 hypothetical protein ASF70_22770 [Rhizobium sp. Leaf321]
MDKINIDLQHCYGINALQHTFDFSKRRQNIVYAPNGVMKTSLALTFKDISEGKPSSDRVHKDRQTKRVVVDGNGADLAADSVFVVEPYNEAYRSNRMSTLLANGALRERYDVVRREIDEKKHLLLSALKAPSGLKDGVEEALATDVTSDPKDFFTAIRRLKPEAEKAEYAHLANLNYAMIFSPKVAEQLKSDSFKADIYRYMEVYDQLVSKSTFFRKGAFNHNNASDVAKSLKAFSKPITLSM